MSSRIYRAYRDLIINSYSLPMAPELVRGKGARLFDAAGKNYIDFSSGIAVSSLGHGYPRLQRALSDQAGKLIHTSNFFLHNKLLIVARKLLRAFDMSQVFFSNSGAEANECALKIARKRGVAINKEKYRVISLNGSFHGRIGLALAASGKPHLWEKFGPQPPGFIHIDANEKELRKAFNKNVCALIVEPYQGESGFVKVPEKLLRLMRRLCNENNALLIVDEVQTGMGRTGSLRASPRTLEADIVTLAKGLGAGLPVGATLIDQHAVGVMEPGDHGSTFGGNALALTAVNAVLDRVTKKEFLKSVEERGSHMARGLKELREAGAPITQLRGTGLLLGIRLDPKVIECKEAAANAMKNGVLVAPAGDNVLRILPPLNIGFPDMDKGLERLGKTLLS